MWKIRKAALNMETWQNRPYEYSGLSFETAQRFRGSTVV